MQKTCSIDVNRIGENIELFENRVAALVAATDPSLASCSPDVAVTELHSRLVTSGKAETERKTLEEQNARDAEVIAGHTSKVQRAEASLKRLMDLARCDSAQELEATIAASEQKAEKRDEYERIAQGLIERNAAPDVTVDRGGGLRPPSGFSSVGDCVQRESPKGPSGRGFQNRQCLRHVIAGV